MLVPLVLSVALGAVVYLLYDAWTAPPRPRAAPRRPALAEFLVRAGLDVSPRDFVLFALGAGLLVGALAQLLLGWPLVSLLAALAGAGAPVAYHTRRHNRRRAAVQTGLVDALAQMRDAIRAGLSVTEACRGLAAAGPEALRPEFAQLVRDARLEGFETALERMAERLADPLWDMAGAALALNDRVGSRNVTAVLDRLAAAARAQQLAREELAAQQAKHVLSARLIAALPLVVLVLVRATNPAYLALFDTAPGQLVLIACGASVALGYAAMLWLARLPAEPRVLRPRRDGVLP